MKLRFNPTIKPLVALCSLTLCLLADRAGAQLTTNIYITTNSESSTFVTGTNWAGTGVTPVWKLNGVTANPAVQPFAGTATGTATNYNFFIMNSNGVALGDGTASTIIRSPYTPSPYYNIDTFPGDTLILNTNTQIRFKHGGSAGNSLVTGVVYNQSTNNFPGNFGQPGLVLNGGCLNVGDSGFAFVIMGTMYAVPGTISYLN